MSLGDYISLMIDSKSAAMQKQIDDYSREQLAYQQSLKAKPAISELDQFKRDPRFQDAESLQVLAQDSPLGTTQRGSDGSWQERTDLNNPYVQRGLSDFQQGSQNTLDAYNSQQGDPMAIARMSQNKDLSSGFENATQGADRSVKMGNTLSDRQQVAELNDFIAQADTGTYGDGTPGSFISDLTKTLRDFQSENGLTSEAANTEVEKFLKSQFDRQKGRAWSTNSKTIGAGNATKRIDEIIDPNGAIVRTESIGNHPPQPKPVAENAGQVNVAWQLNGQPQSAVVQREDLPAFGQELKAQGVKAITVLDGNRAAKQITLTAPDKKGGAFAELLAGSGQPQQIPQPPVPETGVSKSGKPIVKINGQWVYQ